jgi:hypothetical protein
MPGYMVGVILDWEEFKKGKSNPPGNILIPATS